MYTGYVYIKPVGIEVVSASVQNILACKYITPTGIEIVLVVGDIVICTHRQKLAPQVTNMRILVPLHVGEIGRQISVDLYNIQI